MTIRDYDPYSESCDDISVVVDFKDKTFESDNSRIVLTTNFYKIPELNIKFAEGVYLNLNQQGEWEDDFSVTVLFRIDETDVSNFFYYEQDPPAITIANFENLIINKRYYTLEEIENMDIITEKAST